MATVLKQTPELSRPSWPFETVAPVREVPAVLKTRPQPSNAPTADTVWGVGPLTELAGGLPRTLMELSSALLARHNANGLRLRADLDDNGCPSVDAAVGIARYALAEATTAAHTLAQRLQDAARVLALVAPDDGDTTSRT